MVRLKIGPSNIIQGFFVTACTAPYSCILDDVLEVIDEEQEVILPAPTALDDTPPQVKDLVEKVNLGTEEEPMEVGLIGLSPFADHTRGKAGATGTAANEDRNKATPKDVYPMLVVDMLIDAVTGHEMLSFMDGTAGYHQIPVAEILEVYIDDVVVNSKVKQDHIADLRKVFERMRTHGLRMNPTKCVFGVQAGDFLGFVVHQRGIEVLGDKAKAAINAPAPKTKELQQLLGKINFLRRFISNSAGKVKSFSSLLKLQGAKEFLWESCHQEALTG
ncbi:hypothetical protein ACLB2K_073742 [Fragaria x ananassa]